MAALIHNRTEGPRCFASWLATEAYSDPYKRRALVLDDRHEIDDTHGAGLRLKVGFENECVRLISAIRACGLFRGNQPSPVSFSSKQCGEARIRIEAGPTQPIDRALAADQGHRLAIADEAVVLD
jgi:hypothetical protein